MQAGNLRAHRKRHAEVELKCVLAHSRAHCVSFLLVRLRRSCGCMRERIQPRGFTTCALCARAAGARSARRRSRRRRTTRRT
jgi:hypothetical protein